MIDPKLLESMYQQWMQENDTYVQRWLVFVKMASEHFMISQSQMLEELARHRWFKKDQ